VAALVFALTAIGHMPARDFYHKFIGDISPIVAISGCILIGLVCLVVVTFRGWLATIVLGEDRLALPGFALAAFLALVAIIIDLFIRFPEDMNQAFPASLAFYPSIGFLVEVVFHLVPITVFLFLMELLIKNCGKAAVVWSALLIVALIEPLYQTVSMATGRYHLAGLIAVFVNLLVFNVTQVVLFKRLGFLPMYASRLLYYSIWHVIWGHFRIGILYK
jgi:hypothetical protein